MNYLAKTLDKIFPVAVTRLLRAMKQESLVQIARFYHVRALWRIRRKVRRGAKIRVLFLDSETAKWKVQTLFERMANDERFDPTVGISRRDMDENRDLPSVKCGMDGARRFFERLGNHCVDVYDSQDGSRIDLRKFSPDIIFYQQPWNIYGCHFPAATCRFALTCYVPYYVPSYGIPKIEAQMPFHRFIALYFTLNEAWSAEYKKGVHSLFFSGKMYGLGNPILDVLTHGIRHEKDGEKKQVIYAPHFSISKESEKFKPLVSMSTFLENGREILSYAIAHPEFKWVFKPHPVLKTALVDSGAWTTEEVSAYYLEWARIGDVCDEGDYMRLFANASLMITDCGSFLSEFGATGRPIIHLMSRRNKLKPCTPCRKLFSTYYEVRSLEELYSSLGMILEKDIDPQREHRLAAVKEANLADVNAAQRIMDFLEQLFQIK